MKRATRSRVFSLLASTLCWGPVASAQPFAPRLYQVAVEIALPHLEENLRYATTYSTLCIGRAQLATAFPILEHEALKGCKLDHEHSAASSVRLLLRCGAGNGTTGAAEWRVDELGIHGTLDVKLGGKNMTFYQRIRGRPVGACVPDDR